MRTPEQPPTAQCGSRHLAGVLALLSALPSCITATLWHDGNTEHTETPIACDQALLLASDDPAVQRLALRVPAASLGPLGLEPVAGEHAWLSLLPDDGAELCHLLQRARQQRLRAVEFQVDFTNPQEDHTHSASLHLYIEVDDDDRAAPVLDAQNTVPPPPSERVHCDCRWQLLAAPPGGGESLEPPKVTVYCWHTKWPVVCGKALATPATVAVDVLLLPFEAALILWYAYGR